MTQEDAAVKVLLPESPLLNVPNKITIADFEGWVQERGLYFANKWDPQYETPIESHDKGHEEQPGGMLYTRYGKGAYIFTAYSWFRELPAGVPGRVPDFREPDQRRQSEITARRRPRGRFNLDASSEIRSMLITSAGASLPSLIARARLEQ